MNPVISVIVPIYNVEKYLRKCLDSVTSQTYTNLEIILVDDGSTDNCGAICDEYAMNDDRITVIHKVNSGVGFARNSGLEICTGEYVMFVDPDDWLSVDAVQVLYDRLVIDGSDIAVGKHVEAYEDGVLSDISWKFYVNELLTKENIFKNLVSTADNIIPVAAWGKLYKRSIFNNIRYTSVCIAEDLLLFPYIIEQCEKISISTPIVYYYYQRQNSLVRQRSEKAKFDLADVTLHVAEYLYEKGYIQSAKLWYTTAVSRILVIQNSKDRSELIKRYFDDPSKRALLKDVDFKTRVKWMALHIPVLVKIRDVCRSIKNTSKKDCKDMKLNELTNKSILITGSSGFIGSNLVLSLIKQGISMTIVGLDNVNDYYDISLKEYRLRQIEEAARNNPSVKWYFVRGSIADKALVDSLFEEYHFDIVVNLAAQAGVRYSIDHPDVYIESNVIGFYNILEACRRYPVKHLVYASSSSVYGSNKKIPYSTEDKVDNPVSLYAATKKSNELFAHAYSKLYNIPSTGLRFFTVYGPAGRPDMAYFGFTNKLIRGETIEIFNYGNCQRDFTYVDDIVEGVLRVMQSPPKKKMGEDGLPIPPYAVYNIGNNSPENLLDFVNILAEELIAAKVLPEDFDISAHSKLVPMQPGDVPITYADVTPLERDFGFKPSTSLREGLRAFALWYKDYYKV